MFNVNDAFKSLPDELCSAMEKFEARSKEVPSPFGFHSKDSKPSNIIRSRLVIENRSFLQKLMMLYYFEGNNPLNLESIEEGGVTCPLLTLKGWIPDKPILPEDIDYQWDLSSPLPKNRWEGLAELLRQECGITVSDDKTYRLLGVFPCEESHKLSLKFTQGTYEDYIETCEALTWELAQVLLRLYDEETQNIKTKVFDGRKILQKVKSKLLRRNILNPFDFLSRSMTPGTDSLTVISTDGGNRNFFLMHKRQGAGKEKKPDQQEEIKPRKALAEAIGTWHVVPAGTFQPLDKDDGWREIELKIERNIMREFGEELLNKEDLISQWSVLGPDIPYEKDGMLKGWKEMFESRNVEVRFLGCTLDCVNLKPEFLTLLVINRDRLMSRVSKDLIHNWEGEHAKKEFTREELTAWMKRSDVLPAGAGCLALALRHYGIIMDIAKSVGAGE